MNAYEQCEYARKNELMSECGVVVEVAVVCPSCSEKQNAQIQSESNCDVKSEICPAISTSFSFLFHVSLASVSARGALL